MKTKIAYMVIGAIVASVGYFVGTFNNLNAEDDIARVKKLIVSESIVIDDGSGLSTVMSPGMTATFTGKYGSILMPHAIKFNFIGNEPDNDIKGLSMGYIFAPDQDFPTIELRDDNHRVITLQISDESLIKLGNGGLKSKTIKVD